MITDLDAMQRYAELRRDCDLPPHQETEPQDLELLHFYLCGVIAGTQATLLKVKEARGR